MYSYHTNTVNIINSTLQPFTNLTVRATIYNLDGTEKFTEDNLQNVDGDGVKQCFALHDIEGLSAVYFLRLELKNSAGKVESINWYWLSAKKDELNWKKSTWYYTPQSVFADYSPLSNMPKATLKVSHTSAKTENGASHEVTLSNTGKTVAFFVHVRALKEKGGEDILPVIFEDNYITLAPGETRTINCSYLNTDSGKSEPYFLINGWNVDAVE